MKQRRAAAASTLNPKPSECATASSRPLPSWRLPSSRRRRRRRPARLPCRHPASRAPQRRRPPPQRHGRPPKPAAAGPGPRACAPAAFPPPPPPRRGRAWPSQPCPREGATCGRFPPSPLPPPPRVPSPRGAVGAQSRRFQSAHLQLGALLRVCLRRGRQP